MSEPLLFKHKNLIHLLSSLSHKKKAQIIASFKKEHVCCLSEIFRNFLKRKLTDDKDIIKRLRRYKKDIKNIALKRTPLKDKIKLLISKRGGNILAVLLPLAVKLISSFMKK